jgi:hypothetical protein
MFSEEQFINAYFGSAAHQTWTDDDDYEDLRPIITSFCDMSLASFSIADFRDIVGVYYTSNDLVNIHMTNAQYRDLGTQAIYRLCPKILSIFIAKQFSDAEIARNEEMGCELIG